MTLPQLQSLTQKARQQPLTSWGQCCVVKLLCHSAARLEQNDWREALQAATRAYRKQGTLTDGRRYAAQYLTLIRRMAKERLNEIDAKKERKDGDQGRDNPTPSRSDSDPRLLEPQGAPLGEKRSTVASGGALDDVLLEVRRNQEAPRATQETKRKPQKITGEIGEPRAKIGRAAPRCRLLTSEEQAKIAAARSCGLTLERIGQETGGTASWLSRLVLGKRATREHMIRKILAVAETVYVPADPEERAQVEREYLLRTAHKVREAREAKQQLRALTPEEIDQVKAVIAAGKTHGTIASEAGIGRSRLSALLLYGSKTSPVLIHRLLKAVQPKEAAPIDDHNQRNEQQRESLRREIAAKKKERILEPVQAPERAALPTADAPTAPPIQEDQREVDRDPSRERALRARYWSAIAGRNEAEIQSVTRLCREAGLADLYATTKEQINNNEGPLREIREFAVRAWEER